MQRRKDDKGRVLRDGESYRPKERRYMYRYTSIDGKRHAVYAADLNELRQKEEKIQRDIAGGIHRIYTGKCEISPPAAAVYYLSWYGNARFRACRAALGRYSSG